MTGGTSVSAGRPQETVSFNIAAQPLQSALDAYSAAAGFEVLYNSKLAFGRSTKGLMGVFTPKIGLKNLLKGTGLTVIYAGEDAFAVVLAPAAQSHAIKPPAYRQYFGIVQASIASTFCGDTEIQPGTYRIAVKFWIDPDGQVRRPELLGSSRDSARDRAVSDALERVIVALPPPKEMPQPITMIIMPRSPQVTGDCDSDQRESQ
ncbi:MAG: TonB family protein [Pseudomonadota bacterium]